MVEYLLENKKTVTTCSQARKCNFYVNKILPRYKSDCFSFPCLWKPSSSGNGILYRTSETVIVADNVKEEILARVEGFIFAVVDGQFHSFCKRQTLSHSDR